jgi:hypothetical protein
VCALAVLGVKEEG